MGISDRCGYLFIKKNKKNTQNCIYFVSLQRIWVFYILM